MEDDKEATSPTTAKPQLKKSTTLTKKKDAKQAEQKHKMYQDSIMPKGGKPMVKSSQISMA